MVTKTKTHVELNDSTTVTVTNGTFSTWAWRDTCSSLKKIKRIQGIWWMRYSISNTDQTWLLIIVMYNTVHHISKVLGIQPRNCYLLKNIFHYTPCSKLQNYCTVHLHVHVHVPWKINPLHRTRFNAFLEGFKPSRKSMNLGCSNMLKQSVNEFGVFKQLLKHSIAFTLGLTYCICM